MTALICTICRRLITSRDFVAAAEIRIVEPDDPEWPAIGGMLRVRFHGVGLPVPAPGQWTVECSGCAEQLGRFSLAALTAPRATFTDDLMNDRALPLALDAPPPNWARVTARWGAKHLGSAP